MQTVKKAIIPAAGMGTRFLPATKAMPKEMLPIIDKPTIEYIVEEAILSGIEDIIIVTGKGKRAIEDHFDRNMELETFLLERGKTELLEKMNKSSNVTIHYIRQKEPKGLGHAIWCARKFIGNEPFAVLLGDDIVRSETPCLQQLIQQYEALQAPIIGVQPVSPTETERYGIIEPEHNGMLMRIKHLVEKPKVGLAPSNYAIMGRYILTPELFHILETQTAGVNGEIQLTDALQKLLQVRDVYGFQFAGKRYDVGEQLGYIKTTLEFALAHEHYKYDVQQLLQTLLQQAHEEAK